jgi:hypothetical protein
MIKYFILGILIVKAIFSISQNVKVTTKEIEGIIVNKYINNNMGFYCEMESQLIVKTDTIQFYQKSSMNIPFLRKQPYLESIIGGIQYYESDYMSDYLCGNFSQDLTISTFNLHTQESGANIIKSPAFYVKNEIDCLYTAFQFRGLVNFYEGVNNAENQIFDNCTCVSHTRNTKIAILKEVFELTPLADKQICEMKIKKIGVKSIEVLYCE